MIGAKHCIDRTRSPSPLDSGLNRSTAAGDPFHVEWLWTKKKCRGFRGPKDPQDRTCTRAPETSHATGREACTSFATARRLAQETTVSCAAPATAAEPASQDLRSLNRLRFLVAGGDPFTGTSPGSPGACSPEYLAPWPHCGSTHQRAPRPWRRAAQSSNEADAYSIEFVIPIGAA